MIDILFLHTTCGKETASKTLLRFWCEVSKWMALQYCILLCIIEALTRNKTQIPSFQPCRRVLNDKTYSSVRAVPLQWVKFTLWWASATSLRLTPKNYSSSFSSPTVPLRNRCESPQKSSLMHLKRCGQTYACMKACTHTRTYTNVKISILQWLG